MSFGVRYSCCLPCFFTGEAFFPDLIFTFFSPLGSPVCWSSFSIWFGNMLWFWLLPLFFWKCFDCWCLESLLACPLGFRGLPFKFIMYPLWLESLKFFIFLDGFFFAVPPILTFLSGDNEVFPLSVCRCWLGPSTICLMAWGHDCWWE